MINLILNRKRKVFARGANKGGYVSYAMPLYREDLALLGIDPDNAKGQELVVKRSPGKLVIELPSNNNNTEGDDVVS